MAVTFPGRWESRFTIPTGGASVSATVPNGAGAQTATVSAGNYFLTSAGGVSGLLSTLQTALNAATNGYARTAVATAAMLGYGDFTSGAGWLFDISSGNDTGAFGGVTMTAVNSPTYGHAGPASGGDKAVGTYRDGSDHYFTADNNFNVGATDDLIVALVITDFGAGGSFSYLPIKGPKTATPPLWRIVHSTTLSLRVHDGANQASSQIETPSVPCVVLAAFDRANNVMRIGAQTLAGVQSLGSLTNISSIGDLTNASSLLMGFTDQTTSVKIAGAYIATGSGVANGVPAALGSALTNFANAINAAWSVSLDDDGRVRIGWSGYSTSTWSLTWTSTTLRDHLGFDADISSVTTTQTGAAQAKGLWIPDSPLNVDDHPSMAPEDTDLRTSESPTGAVLGLYGTQKYVHTNLRYQRVPVDRIREANATYDNASLEVFFRDTQTGQSGLDWFSVASPVQVWWNNAGTLELLGSDANDGTGVDGWTITGVSRFADIARPSQQGYVGQFDVKFPRLVSEG